MKKLLVYLGYKTVNYGSILQAFATMEMLKKLDVEPILLNLDGLWKEIRKRKVKFYFLNCEMRFLLHSKGRMYFSKIYEKMDSCYGEKIRNRRIRFDDFIQKKLILSDEVNGFDEASILSEKYDIVLLGSDQVWLPSSVVTDVYTLHFVQNPRITTIAYAPSFGISKIPTKYVDKYKEMISHISHISVREDSGRKIVKEITGIDCPVVADPVLMLNKREWSQNIPYRKMSEDRYVFVYLIGNNRWQREWIRKYALKRNLKTVALIHLDEYIAYDKKYFDQILVDESPMDFLNWIRNANVVFTDSYHCTLFSLIENKDIWCFRRFDDHQKVSTNSRLYTILLRFKLEKRLLSRDSRIEDCLSDKIDFSAVNKKIYDFQKESWDYLNNSINCS